MGLASLIGGPKAARPPSSRSGGVRQLPLDEIQAGSQQPRIHFNDLALEELAASIRANGLIQPIIVRRIPEGYELISGERRFRAAGLAGLQSVPAIVREVDDRTALELALIENLQREDLTAMEIARGYQRLMDNFGYSQTEVAHRVGKERATVANSLRLLRLPDVVADAIDTGVVTQGHGKALLSLDNHPKLLLQLFEKVKRESLSVRQTERSARRLLQAIEDGDLQAGATSAPPASLEAELTPERRAAELLTSILRTRVSIRTKPRGGGQISVAYSDQEELIRLVAAIRGEEY